MKLFITSIFFLASLISYGSKFDPSTLETVTQCGTYSIDALGKSLSFLRGNGSEAVPRKLNELLLKEDSLTPTPGHFICATGLIVEPIKDREYQPVDEQIMIVQSYSEAVCNEGDAIVVWKGCLRPAPSLDSCSARPLYHGQIVEITSETDRFFQIRYKNEKLYYPRSLRYKSQLLAKFSDP